MVILALTIFVIPAFAAGTWKGKIVDAETKESIEGAVSHSSIFDAKSTKVMEKKMAKVFAGYDNE